MATCVDLRGGMCIGVRIDMSVGMYTHACCSRINLLRVDRFPLCLCEGECGSEGGDISPYVNNNNNNNNNTNNNNTNNNNSEGGDISPYVAHRVLMGSYVDGLVC